MTSDAEMEQGRRKKAFVGLMFSLGFLALALVAVVGFAKWKSRGVNYDVVFQDAKGLKVGDKVTLSGYPVGEVRRIRLENEGRVIVTIKLQNEHAEKVKDGSSAYIASRNFPDVSGQKEIEVLNPETEAAPPIKEGETVEGQDSLVAVNAWKLRERLESLGEGAGILGKAAVQGAAKFIDQLRELPDSPEMQKAIEDLKKMVDELSQRGKEGFASFLREWEEWMKALEPLLATAKQKGRERAGQALESARQGIAEAERRLRQGVTPGNPPASAPAGAL